MRYKPGHRDENRERILHAVARGFRRQGFGGSGVDGLAREAGVTSGAFYGYFSSKKEAFGAAVAKGLIELREGIEALQASEGKNWVSAFAAFYLGHKRRCELGGACTLPSLSTDVERSGTEAREVYEAEMREVVAALARGLPGARGERTKKAWALLGLLAGGVSIARTVLDPALSESIAESVIASAVRLAEE